MKMIAKKPLRYATRSLRAGDDFDASPRDARLLEAVGRARKAPAPPPPPKPRTVAAKPAKASAASAASVPAAAPVPSFDPVENGATAAPDVFAPPPAVYTRRDLLSE
jgi:hypothetical protein